MSALTDEQVDKICWALKEISRGGSEPLGIEALAMSISGEGKPGHDPLVGGLNAIAEAIGDHICAVNDVASAINRLAAAVEESQ